LATAETAPQHDTFAHFLVSFLSCFPALSPRHRWKVLAAGVAANAAFSVAFSGIPMTAVLMRTGYQLDNATLGLVLGLMGLGIAVSELPWGLLTDRWGDRPVLLMGLGSTADRAGRHGAVGCAGGGPHPRARLARRRPAAGGPAGRQREWRERARGDDLVRRQRTRPRHEHPPDGCAAGRRHRCAGAAVRGAAFRLCRAVRAARAAVRTERGDELGLGARAGRSRRSHRTPRLQEPTAPESGPLRDPRVWRIVAGIGILCAPQFAVLSFGTVFLHDFGHAGLAAITATMVSMQAGAMVMRVWSGRWTDRRRNRPAYLRACSALSVLLFAGLAALAIAAGAHAADSLALRVALVALLGASGVCVSAWHGVAYTELATLAGAARAGTALGMANTSVFLVCFITPFSIPHLLALQGWPLVWLAASACALVAMPLLVPRPVVSDQKLAKTALSRST
jgi:predicted MFS family arabinose efflux permease